MRLRQIDIRTFVAAILEPDSHFNALKEITAIVDESQTPIFYAGLGSVIFKVRYNNRICALKCYDRSDEEFVDGVCKINSYFNSINSEYIDTSTIYPKELTITNIYDKSVAVTAELYD